MENNKHSYHPEAEEFINADPNQATNSEDPIPSFDAEKMLKNADTDPNRYSNFNTEENTAEDLNPVLDTKNEGFSGESIGTENTFRDANNNNSDLNDNDSNGVTNRDASENENTPNDSDSNYSGIPHYSIEDDRLLDRKSWDTEDEDEKNLESKTSTSESDKEGFFEGL